MANVTQILEAGLVCTLHAPDERSAVSWASAALEGGLQIVAVPVGLPDVVGVIDELESRENLTVALTNVMSEKDLALAVAAGVDLVILPAGTPALIALAKERDLTVCAGATTAVELAHAYEIGADLVAVNPAGLLGVEHFSHLAQMFVPRPVIAFGAIDQAAAPDFLEAGAAAVIVDRGVFPILPDEDAVDLIRLRVAALVELCSESLGLPGAESAVEDATRSQYPPAALASSPPPALLVPMDD